MIDLKKGHPEDARAVLTDARIQVDEWAAGPFEIYNSDGVLWSNWGIARILLKEAEMMLAGKID